MNIMTYEQELALEQEQRLEQGLIAKEERSFFEHYREPDTRPVRFGKGQLCTCGLKCVEDCDCHPF
jgi:hypothetical protein